MGLLTSPHLAFYTPGQNISQINLIIKLNASKYKTYRARI